MIGCGFGSSSPPPFPSFPEWDNNNIKHRSSVPLGLPHPVHFPPTCTHSIAEPPPPEVLETLPTHLAKFYSTNHLPPNSLLACADKATIISVGNDHNDGNDKSGKVVFHIHGKLGHEVYQDWHTISLPSPQNHPLSSSPPLTIVQLAAGKRHVLILTSFGAVYSLGSGFYGQLGLGQSRTIADKPQRVHGPIGDKHVRMIAAGAYHSICVVNEDGNDACEPDSKLSSDYKSDDFPSTSSTSSFFSSSSSSSSHSPPTSTSTKTETIYCFGLNKCNQCSPLSSETIIMSPNKPVALPTTQPFRVVSITAGKSHTTCVIATTPRSSSSSSSSPSSIAVYSWGSTAHGCAGVSTSSPILTSPSPVIGCPPSTTCVSSGDSHTLLLTSQGTVFVWGKGDTGQLGTGSSFHYRNPRPNSFLSKHVGKIKSIYARGDWSACVTVHGELWTWGSDSGGWLGHVLPSPSELQHISTDNPQRPLTNMTQVRTFDSDHDIYLPRRVDCFTMDDGWFGGEVGGKIETVVGGGGFMIALGKIGMGWMDEDTLAKERFSECRETAQGKSRNPQSTRRDDMEEKEGDGGRSYDAKDCDEFSTFADSVSERSQDEWRGGNEVDSSRMFKQTPSSSPQTEIIFRHCRHGRTSQIRSMILSGFNVNTVGAGGNTLLIICAQNNDVETARLCIDYNANANARNDQGNTSMHYSMFYKYTEITKLLRECNADDCAVNNEGLTPYEGLRKTDL